MKTCLHSETYECLFDYGNYFCEISAETCGYSKKKEETETTTNDSEWSALGLICRRCGGTGYHDSHYIRGPWNSFWQQRERDVYVPERSCEWCEGKGYTTTTEIFEAALGFNVVSALSAWIKKQLVSDSLLMNTIKEMELPSKGWPELIMDIGD